MTSQLVVAASLALVVAILASILGAVKRRERVPFVLGIALFIAAHAAVPGFENVAILLAVVGLVVAVASTVPLLRQPA
jgi:low temperature requirement protein LtrA